ncbi:BID domain-containing T4SS effector [Bartonella sp. Raccoon60]|uniref:BID domain-containing T4SS effector n=1 Tax=Bartonella sp. Raccoon60 TaxID=1933912 RepID=UPI0009C25CE3|nr:BID domain-containing T4SS effector [Bartonella sp. Raccoon60]AQX26142.1 Bartonella effector protein Bep5/2 [Bartonella sp. Raccoon60]
MEKSPSSKAFTSQKYENGVISIGNKSSTESIDISQEELRKSVEMSINVYMIKGLYILPEEFAFIKGYVTAADSFLRDDLSSSDFSLKDFLLRDYLLFRDLTRKKFNIPVDKVLLNGYVYANSLTLKNKYELQGIEFRNMCAYDVSEAEYRLKKEPLPEKFDSSYLKYLHKCLFEKTFEWAGHTCDIPFTFLDGTVTTVPVNNKIKDGLERIDQILAEKNNLKGLSHKEFVYEASMIFALFSNLRPFAVGNGCAQRIFMEQIAEAAGYRLDFSVVTERRMRSANNAALPRGGRAVGNIAPMCRLFEDISNPEKVDVLREFFMNVIRNAGSFDEYAKVTNRVVVVPNEGSTYTGICKGYSPDSIMLMINNKYVICKKDYFAPETLTALRLGDKLTFRASVPENFENILIPEEKVAPLTEKEIVARIAGDIFVQKSRQKIKTLSKSVYKSSKILDADINLVNIDSGFGEQYIRQNMSLFKYMSKLAGTEILGIDSPRRKQAKKDYFNLTQEFDNYISIVVSRREHILQEHQEKQERCQQAIKIPSQAVQNILSMSEEDQIKALNANPSLCGEITGLVDKVKDRLTFWEYQTLDDRDYEKLAESVGISFSRAQKVTEIIKKAQKVCRLTRSRAHESKKMEHNLLQI